MSQFLKVVLKGFSPFLAVVFIVRLFSIKNNDLYNKQKERYDAAKEKIMKLDSELQKLGFETAKLRYKLTEIDQAVQRNRYNIEQKLATII
jgi:predicted  nucleic acid-binding Zn-ribbon protein